jgi:phage gpG-like protein
MLNFKENKFTATIQTPKANVKKDTTKKMKTAMNRAISKGVIAGAARIETGLSRALDNAMQAEVWKWPNSTLRESGTIVSSPRDIVDTGTLMQSKKISTAFSVTKTTISVYYNNPYAMLVHYGGMVRPYGNVLAATKQIPARPWIRAVMKGGVPSIEPYDFNKVLREQINEAWTSQFG